MTTVSVPHTAREQNEREVFEQSINKMQPMLSLEHNGIVYEDFLVQAMWNSWQARGQHQQKRIDGLEALVVGIKHSALISSCEDADKLESQIESLQAKLNVAVEALESINKLASMRIGTIAYEVEKQATEALAEINKIGE